MSSTNIDSCFGKTMRKEIVCLKYVTLNSYVIEYSRYKIKNEMKKKKMLSWQLNPSPIIVTYQPNDDCQWVKFID